MRRHARTLEAISQALMIAGIIALVQPWSHLLHRYSVTVILIGLIGFSVFIKTPSQPGPK